MYKTTQHICCDIVKKYIILYLICNVSNLFKMFKMAKYFSLKL